MALVNPGMTNANVTMTAYRPDGVKIDEITRPLAALGKRWGFVRNLFSLAGNGDGWIKAVSDQPLVGLEVMGANDEAAEAVGVAAMSSQGGGTSLYFGHYVVSSTWWTLLGLANLDEMSSTNVVLNVYSDDGTPTGIAPLLIASIPTLPLPAKRSNTLAPGTSAAITLNTDSLTLSFVGLIQIGADILLARSLPDIILIIFCIAVYISLSGPDETSP